MLRATPARSAICAIVAGLVSVSAICRTHSLPGNVLDSRTSSCSFEALRSSEQSVHREGGRGVGPGAGQCLVCGADSVGAGAAPAARLDGGADPRRRSRRAAASQPRGDAPRGAVRRGGGAHRQRPLPGSAACPECPWQSSPGTSTGGRRSSTSTFASSRRRCGRTGAALAGPLLRVGEPRSRRDARPGPHLRLAGRRLCGNPLGRAGHEGVPLPARTGTGVAVQR